MSNINKKNLLFKPSKLKNISFNLAYLYSFNENLQNRIINCGKTLVVSRYLINDNNNEKNIVEQSIMCETKFCPLCNFYRSLRYSYSIECAMQEFANQGYDFLFLTLTVPNCHYKDLGITLDKMSYSFHSGLMKTKQFKQFIGYIKTTELTFKNRDGKAHPHFHAIIICDKNYRHKSNKLYIDNKAPMRELSRMWYKYYMSCDKYLDTKTNKHKFCFNWSNLEETDNGLICSIMPIKPKRYRNSDGKLLYKDKIKSAVDEVAKYITKSNDLKNVTPSDMEVIYNQLKGKRFISSSSNIKLNSYKVEKARDSELLTLIERFLYIFSSKEKKYIFNKMIANNITMPNSEEFEEFERGYIKGSMEQVRNQIKLSRGEDMKK